MSNMKQDKKEVSRRINSIDVKREVWESGIMATSIANMKRRGVPKSEAVRLSGAPYEIVDRYYRGDQPAPKGEKDD